MAKLVDWIKEKAGDETIEAVVIGQMGWGDYGSEHVPGYADHPRGRVLSWDEAAKFLGYEFDEGFGSPGCEAVYVWTPTKVLFVVQYDGATSMTSVPRNPVDTMPEMPGG